LSQLEASVDSEHVDPQAIDEVIGGPEFEVLP
jgi:hypothetical protein